ncbi:hypothetical protein MO973_13760 [Paenibacillus sp. TRM 82003]|nr:hypothetical protein [Paenibacillus sp. TRM 82003]
MVMFDEAFSNRAYIWLVSSRIALELAPGRNGRAASGVSVSSGVSIPRLSTEASRERARHAACRGAAAAARRLVATNRRIGRHYYEHGEGRENFEDVEIVLALHEDVYTLFPSAVASRRGEAEIPAEPSGWNEGNAMNVNDRR